MFICIWRQNPIQVDVVLFPLISQFKFVENLSLFGAWRCCPSCSEPFPLIFLALIVFYDSFTLWLCDRPHVGIRSKMALLFFRHAAFFRVLRTHQFFSSWLSLAPRTEPLQVPGVFIDVPFGRLKGSLRAGAGEQRKRCSKGAEAHLGVDGKMPSHLQGFSHRNKNKNKRFGHNEGGRKLSVGIWLMLAQDEKQKARKISN